MLLPHTSRVWMFFASSLGFPLGSLASSPTPALWGVAGRVWLWVRALQWPGTPPRMPCVFHSMVLNLPQPCVDKHLWKMDGWIRAPYKRTFYTEAARHSCAPCHHLSIKPVSALLSPTGFHGWHRITRKDINMHAVPTIHFCRREKRKRKKTLSRAMLWRICHSVWQNMTFEKVCE